MDERLYIPFWKGEQVFEESVVLVKGDGLPEGRLLFPPKEILSVVGYDGSVSYPAEEYGFSGNRIFAREGSSLPYMTEEMTRGKGEAEKLGLSSMDGIVFTETTGIVKFQIKVTYIGDKRAAPWTVLPVYKGDRLRNFRRRLGEGKGVRVLLYGDSIAAGCHASSVLGYPPYLPVWGRSFCDIISERYGVEAELVNLSVGGFTSRQGAESFDGKLLSVGKGTADLAIFAFGMNDGSWKIPREEYRRNMESLVGRMRLHSPDCDIAIVSTILANPLCTQDKAFTRSYRLDDEALADRTERCAEVDMTTVSEGLYARKKGLDLLANDINHPTDFFVRIYTMYLCETLLGGN